MKRARSRRMIVAGGIFTVLFALVALRALDLAVLRGPALARLAAMQHHQRIELLPHRGPIVDRSGDPLALSVDVPSIYVRPRELRAAGADARLPALATALHMPPRALRAKLASSQPFVWLKRQALPREAETVARLELPGVYTVTEGRRFYPHGNLAAHVLGFVGVDSQGLEGLEQRYDRVIRGEPQYLEFDRDARGREMFTGGVGAAPDQGNRLELTLDAAIQEATERELQSGVAAARAVGGAAVVLDPATGEVLALANVPTYNPNEPGDAADRRWRDRVRNRAITDPYEPGSTFKAVLAAAAIEEHLVTPGELFFCEHGRFQAGGRTIHDAHPYGWLSFAEVIQFSSNIGATKVGERLGRDRYHRYLRAFGFGNRTGIELPGETPGIMRPVESWSRIDLATLSFGQGVSVTPLQMSTAFAAIANGGTLLRPYVVRRIVAPGGEVVLENEPTAVRRVISTRSARTTTELLRRVVEEEGGTGTKARLEEFPVAGKTGTAQKVDPTTGGYSSKRIGSFAGFVPADEPRAVILVLIDEPSTSSYGGVVAAPVFRAIAAAVLKRLGVEPPAPTVVARAPGAAPATPRAKPASREAATPANAETPSFLGLSLREALARAQASGWQVRVTGTGYVAAQEPMPGTPLLSVHQLALRLAPAEAVASP
ncbi:MAG: PASTA domain-containing protein [Deltaproteobacteria bacterium]|nr:MAG: PASTA domain-containing protein [Deltaproteobacteria bacterium]